MVIRWHFGRRSVRVPETCHWGCRQIVCPNGSAVGRAVDAVLGWEQQSGEVMFVGGCLQCDGLVYVRLAYEGLCVVASGY